MIFGYDHFHRPAMEGIVDGKPVLYDEQPDVANFEGWTALASSDDGYDLTTLKQVLVWRDNG